MKIGIVCYPSVGGSGIVATDLGNQLALLGHEIHFISYERPFRLGSNSANVFFNQVKINEYELFRYPDYTLPLAVKIGDISQKYSLDIIHAHYAIPHATAALLAKNIVRHCSQQKPKVVTTLHGTDITLLARDPNLRSIIQYSIEESDGVTAVSNSLREESISLLGIKKAVEVIYNFYQPKIPAIPAAQIRKDLGIGTDEFMVIHLSNLRPVKRIPDLLRIVAASKHVRKLKLVILSGGNFEQFLPLVDELKLKNNIIVRENILDIENYINAADLGIYPSETESFGMGILETLSFGKPVLASNSGGIPEVMQHGRTGYLYPVGDVQSFTQGLDELIENPQERQKMGERGKVRAQSLFNTEKIVKEYFDFYQKTLNS
ncbi:MAG: N-acetyl-alpha-D-glucosaminyl L-malate synthase BshA [Candidatus Doudnabacteria bacterium]